ncbi:alpha/beta fold hydrolase [Caulobacter sp. ErkDOM-YI]|uniref:alpha/beta fold hydrolase n=1 Tax=unclassified Caulobacter TaxID=2648921 RepID=UPI003AF741B4
MSKFSGLMAALILTCAPGLATAQAPDRPAVAAPVKAIHEEGFVRIGGIEQWVTIHGEDRSRPVILMAHGGPGNPMTPYANPYFQAWEKDFVIAQWDQRGAGMTFGQSPPAEGESLTVERLRDDGIEVAAYVSQRLGKQKLILMGGSWSSILGTHMAKARPDLFHAYVGSSHLARSADNLKASYDRTLELARAGGDQDAIGKLETVGPPPWTNPRNFGIIRRITRKYEAARTDPAPAQWMARAPAYETPKALADYEGGEDYSYIEFVGMKGQGMYSKTDLYALGPKFALPVYVILGEQDLISTPEVARAWFDTLQAPDKAFVLLPRTGHDPNPAMAAAQLEILKTKVLPRIGKGG